MNAKPLVYSYLRFSDVRQAAGSSAERQIAYAERWAQSHDMALDEQLSLRDEGLSAYHQRHVKQGALGAFLRAAENGQIPVGSVLVVEGLDRLSRAEPIQAQAQLAQIVNAGITVVTASDGREYNRESLKRQPMDLVYSLLVMIRAHEESDTKSKRVKAAIRRQCEAWVAGTWKGQIRNGKDPHWVRWAGTEFELVPERVAPLRRALSLYKDGHGALEIIRRLAADKQTISANGLDHAPNFYKIIKNRCLVGERTLEVDGTTYQLQGYYPAVCTEAEFAELRHVASKRGHRKGRGEIPSIVTGMRMTFCGYCGNTISTQNLMSRNRRDDGAPQHGHRRLLCLSNQHGDGCVVPGSCSVVPIEHAILRFCADAMNLNRLAEGDEQERQIAADIARLKARHGDIASQLDRITEALIVDEGPGPAAFRRKATELEALQASLEAEISALEYEQAATARGPSGATADAWSAVVTGVERLDYDSRMRARQLVADTFSRIVVYHHGIEPGPINSKTGAIDLLLVGKRGSTRLLHIDRQTGAWRAGEELNVHKGDPLIPLPPGMV